MASGGARNRSGPMADPNSGRSDARGFTLTALPATYDGEIPEFPLSNASVREVELWQQKWSGPHGAAWSQPSETWRHHTVALWVRTAVRCEDPDVPASLLGQLHRFADQSGLTTAGLAEMGWAVAVDALAAKRSPEPAKAKSSRDRMKVVGGSGS